MARPRSAHVLEVKASLTARLRSALAPAGGRFLSARAVAQRFAISYQTAHRLLVELEDEGLLRREPASGTFHPGKRRALRGAQLIFHPRARRKGSFGDHLASRLTAALAARGIRCVRSWADDGAATRFRADFHPVIWECRDTVAAAASARRFALLLNDAPPAGLGSGYVDAVTTDDFSGGACAAELLKERIGSDRLTVLGGPAADRRSMQRISGFRAHAPDAIVICAESWFVEGGRARAEAVLATEPRGIFACNDRLAEAVIDHCRKAGRPLPPLVGFDNAPVAERLHLTTIGIPWDAFVALAVESVVARVDGSEMPARTTTLSHQPVVRLT